MEKWIADVVGKMHINKIRQFELADELHCTREYVSMVLTGKRTPKDAEKIFSDAVDKLIERKQKLNE